MNKTLLILKHEFKQMVRSKSFIILTLLFPLIGFTALGIFQLTQVASKPVGLDDTYKIGYIDEVGGFEEYLGISERITLVPYSENNEATQALLAEDIDEYFIIPANYLEQGTITRYHTEKELEMSGETYQAIKIFLQDNLLKGQTSPEIAERVKYPLGIYNIRLDETGDIATDQGGFAAFLVPMVFGFLLVMAIGTSSGSLLQGMAEEKQNRIMEILLSSVSTRQLLLGKVLGLGGAALVQIAFWVLSMSFLLQLSANTVGGFFTDIQIPENILIIGIVYFILGYLFFSIMQAGLGAIIPSPKEIPQITVAFIFPAILPFYVAILILQDHPDHIIGTILTLFPVSAPMSVFIRMGISEIALWELILSIIILILSIIGGLWLAAKTFRVFLLMYGKTPRLGEILHLLKQA
ncbi:ABC transporter permease [Chloroflexota bacterium]